jgi:CheY-like chemotaxis protein
MRFFNKLRFKIALMAGLLLAGLSFVTLFLVSQAIDRQSTDAIRAELGNTQKVFEGLLKERENSMRAQAFVLADSVQFDPKQGAFKILVVEDDAALSEILVETLKKNFPEAQTAQAFDGFEAGKKLVSFAPDLVILDLILPGMDGFNIIENIRSDSDNRRTRILAITGHDSADNRQKVLQAGNADALIIKPIQLEDFKAQVRVQIAEAQRIKGA